MTGFLLFLSLILNLAAIFAIILLYLRQNRLIETEKKQGKIITEIEEVFSAYLLELKEENDKFFKLIKASDAEHLSKKEFNSGRARWKEENKGPDAGKKNAVSYQEARKAYAKSGDAPDPMNDGLYPILPDAEEKKGIPIAETDQPTSEPALLDQILELKKGGLTIEDIARRLNKGKTEIELLLKFRRNGEE